MKNRIKGFTLVECIIALAILAIATLTMAQIYAGVASMNRANQMDNTSISNQVEYIEKMTKTEATAIYYGTNSSSNEPDENANKESGSHKPPHKSTSLSSNNYIQIKNKNYPAEEYSYPVDLFVFESRDNEDNAYSSSMNGQYKDHFKREGSGDQYNMRYKYLTPHKNKTTT